MRLALFIAVCVLAGLLVLRFLLKMIFRGVMADVAADAGRRLAGKTILRRGPVNFFGRQKAGRAQIRGNGELFLLEESLVFIMAMPRRELVIPLDCLESVSLVKSHLGKAVFSPLLRVDYEGEDGRDAVAWWVKDPGQWKDAVLAAWERKVQDGGPGRAASGKKEA
ncbi:MAG: hypothetical protein KKA60_16130 [Proteobacteria bacterium]|nr:hypothetical protein [Pseudomonadota bacterium]